jgi:hypothetical protein
MTELSEKIRSRGYWDVAILPEPYKPDRYRYDTLDGAIGRASVQMRGWPVPYVDGSPGMERGSDWIGSGTDWEEYGHVEAWRFFMSGQFNELRAITPDWAADGMSTSVPGGFPSVIAVWEILYYITEVFELAARLTIGGPPVDTMRVVIKLNGLDGRALVVGQPNRAPFVQPYRATIPEFLQERTLLREEMVAEASRIALDVSREFLLRFGWQPASDQLAEMQRELTTASEM